MEDFLGYSDDPVFQDLSSISSQSDDLLEEQTNVIGGHIASKETYSFAATTEPLYSANNESLLANTIQKVADSLSGATQQTTQSLQVDNSEVNASNSIGCGCAACCGDSAVSGYDDSTYVDSSGNILADAQVSGENGHSALTSGYSWPTDGNSLTLTYNFVTSLPGYYSGVDSAYTTGFAAMTSDQAAASRAILNVIENYINIDFVEVGAGAASDMAFMQVARAENNVVAHAWYPTGGQVGGDVFLNTNFWGYDSDPNYGDLVYQTLFHEIGHALGLKHSFDDSRGSGDILAAGEENNQYSVMSYTRVGGNAGSMMMHDIAELQRLYGVNETHNSGNDTYILGGITHYTIWDTGGTDTIDGSVQHLDLTIRLDEASLSEVGSTRVGIAFGVDIENATGGTGNDTIYGNELNNVILGGNGNDTVYGSTGNDTINGQGGNDTISYTYNGNEFGYNFINSFTVAINHLAEGFTDTLSNFETFLFNGVSYTFASLQSTFANEAPVLTVNNLNLVNGNDVFASSAITAVDADDDVLTYTVLDNDAGANTGYFQLDGAQLAAGQNHTLTEAEFSRLRIVGGSEAGTETLSVRVSDGQITTDWQDITLTSTISGNQAPTVTANNLTLADGANALASTAITAHDANGDELTYKVWDATGANTSGYFELNGVQLAAGISHTLTAAQFAQLRIVGGDAAGNDNLWVQVDDGSHNTAWTAFTLTSTISGGGEGGGNTTTNAAAPVVTANNLSLNDAATALASSTITASDADGNPLTYYVWDAGKGATSGYFELDGSALATGRSIELTEAEFSRLNIVGGDDAGTETMWVRVSDGTHITSWVSFSLDSTVSGNGSGGGNNSSNDAAPVVTANDLTLAGGATATASSVISATDADGNAITYDLWDAGRGADSGYFELDGVALASGRTHTLSQEQFDRVNIVGGDASAGEVLWVRVSDGVHTTAWQSFTLTSTGGGGGGGGGGGAGGNVNDHTPTVTANDVTLDQGATSLASSVITANDADGNQITYYLWDAGRGADSGYFELDGVELTSGRSHVLSQAQFDRVNIVGGDNAQDEILWVKVSDGSKSSPWLSFDLTSTGNAPGGMEVDQLLDMGSEEQDALDALASDDQVVSGNSGDTNLYGSLEDTGLADALDTQNSGDQIL